MNCFETLATVNAEGHLLVAGVPFAPRTEVEVTISSVSSEHDVAISSLDIRAQRLLSALNKARNVESVGKFNREELHDCRAFSLTPTSSSMPHRMRLKIAQNGK